MGIVRIRERKALRLIPFLLSDGGITPKSKNSWTVYFRNNSPELIREVRKRIFDLSKKEGLLEKRKDGSFMAKLNSKEIGKMLIDLTNTYRTKECEAFPKCPKFYGGRLPCKICTFKSGKKIYPEIKIPKEIFDDKNLSKYFL